MTSAPLPDGVRVCLGRFAKAELFSLARAFTVAPGLLLQVISESYLDAASGDGALQSELASAAVELRVTGKVPGCWLSLEGRDEDAEPNGTVEQIE